MTSLVSILKSRERYLFAHKGPSSKSYGFSCSHVWLRGLDHKESLDLKDGFIWIVLLEMMLLECPLDCEEIHPVHPTRDQSLIFIRKTDVEAHSWILLQRDAKWPWCWERLKSWEGGADREWDGWIVSLIQRTWFWAISWNWWWTGRPGMLQSLGSQRVGLNWQAENELRHPGKLEFHRSVIWYSPGVCKESETNDDRTSKSRHILVDFFFLPTSLLPEMFSLIARQLHAFPGCLNFLFRNKRSHTCARADYNNACPGFQKPVLFYALLWMASLS